MHTTDLTIRTMASEDLEQVVGLDAMASGLTRSDFFRRRWQAMETNPQPYIGLISAGRDNICGFIFGHVLTGEFGARKRLAIIDGLAVTMEQRGCGVGTELMEAFKNRARELECVEIRTLAEWGRQDLLGFFARTGFTPAPVNVLEKSFEHP
jgi:predicted N-acetyltransferase YhbS